MGDPPFTHIRVAPVQRGPGTRPAVQRGLGTRSTPRRLRLRRRRIFSRRARQNPIPIFAAFACFVVSPDRAAASCRSQGLKILVVRSLMGWKCLALLVQRTKPCSVAVAAMIASPARRPCDNPYSST